MYAIIYFRGRAGDWIKSKVSVYLEDVPFIWTTAQQESFDKFKKVFMSTPCLAIFKLRKSVRIETDTSDKGVGACILQQNKEEKWHPIAYILKKMISAEFNYDIYDKKLLAIVAVFQIQKIYIEGISDITVFTDYKNLTNFCITKQLNRQQVRQSELLLQYKFKIEYRPGKENGKADVLNKKSDIIEKKKIDFTVYCNKIQTVYSAPITIYQQP